MSGPEIDPREYGRMEARVQHLEVAVRDMNEDVKAMRHMMEQGRGGWKVIAALVSASSAFSAAATWLVTNLAQRGGA